jgi:hypothetical protein
MGFYLLMIPYFRIFFYMALAPSVIPPRPKKVLRFLEGKAIIINKSMSARSIGSNAKCCT